MKKTSMDKSSDPGGFMKILRNPGINCQHQVKYLNFLRETDLIWLLFRFLEKFRENYIFIFERNIFRKLTAYPVKTCNF